MKFVYSVFEFGRYKWRCFAFEHGIAAGAECVGGKGWKIGDSGWSLLILLFSSNDSYIFLKLCNLFVVCLLRIARKLDWAMKLEILS